MAEAAREWNADVKDLGEKIVGLSLLQAKELADYLKEEHGIEAAAGGAVMMAAPAQTITQVSLMYFFILIRLVDRSKDTVMK